MTASPIRVLIADDNPSVRRALKLRINAAPDLTVIGAVSTGNDAVTVARREHPDVVLMDLEMPNGSGLAATRRLATDTATAAVKVIVLTNHALHAFVLEALDAGAVGYLLKTHDGREFLHAIRGATRGEAFVSSRVAMPVLRAMTQARATARPAGASADVLSRAERAVVTNLASGYTSNDDLARVLGVSVNTVRSHLASALRKTNTEDRTQLAIWAVQRGLGVAVR